MTQDLIQALDANIRESQAIAELGEALNRLSRHRDFQKIIQEGYFRDEAVRLVHLKADPSQQTPERQAAIVAQIDAIGTLSGYFRTVFHNAALAKKAIAADEETREDLLAGGEA